MMINKLYYLTDITQTKLPSHSCCAPVQAGRRVCSAQSLKDLTDEGFALQHVVSCSNRIKEHVENPNPPFPSLHQKWHMSLSFLLPGIVHVASPKCKCSDRTACGIVTDRYCVCYKKKKKRNRKSETDRHLK